MWRWFFESRFYFILLCICKSVGTFAETYLKGYHGKYPRSATCGFILRILIYAFRVNVFSLICISFASALFPQLRIPRVMPDAILTLDPYGIFNILALLLEVAILLSFLDIAVLISVWLFTFLLTVNDVVDAMRWWLLFYFDPLRKGHGSKYKTRYFLIGSS